MKLVVRRLRRHPGLAVGGLLLLALILGALFAVALSPHPWAGQDVARRLTSPDAVHWFGTDELGRDIFSRILYGGRISLAMGLIAVGVGLGGGILLGSLSGFYGGWIDAGVQLVTEILLAFPSILLALAVVAILGPGVVNTMIAVGFASIPVFTRLVRAQFLTLRDTVMAEAGRAIGLRDSRLIIRHILPNALGPIVVEATMRVGTALLTASTMSFLGLGAQPPLPEWGAMLSNGRNQLFAAPHVAIFPGMAITLSVIAINLIGDAMRDLMDPRYRRA